MRELMGEVTPTAPVADALTIGEVGRRYLTFLERGGRKLSTRTAV